MKKIAIIVQRYGQEVSGGGEFYAKALAEHLKERYDVTVLTTTSLEYMDWDQYYPSGEGEIDGVRVLRFRNQKGRDWAKFQALSDELCKTVRSGGQTSPEKDLEWADAEGPYCPDLVKYVEKHKDDYEAFLVITYIYYTAIRCLPLVAEKAIFIPTAHDDVWMRFSIFHEMFQMPRWFAFLTNGEQEFVRYFYRNDEIPGEIIGCGVDLPQQPDAERFRKKYGIRSQYIAFVGRVDTSKSCDEMVRYFCDYKRRHASNIKLVLIGKSSMEIPTREDIVCTGFISEQDKFDGIAGAVATVAPSKFESLCIALLESFACGVPALVNGECAILKEHCTIGKCGVYYTNSEEFCEGMDYLLKHPQIREGMGRNAQVYISENYTWAKVLKKLSFMIEDIAAHPGLQYDKKKAKRGTRSVLDEKQQRARVLIPGKHTKIEPAFPGKGVTVCFSSSDYFAPICGVALGSLLANRASDRYYDIFIMLTDMSTQNKNLLAGMAEGMENVSLRFIDVTQVIKDYQFSLASYYTQFTFYRLLIPSLMSEYEKVLYLDSDMVIHHDIAELYDTDMGDSWIAATLDTTVICWQKMDDTSPMHQYLDSLDLLQAGSYFQGGVSLYNIPALSRQFTTEYLLQKASERSYLTCDQDLMNICCKGHIKFVSQQWNMVVMKDVHVDLYHRYLPQKYYDAYIEARKDPYIVHYGAQLLPCFEVGVDFYPLFWSYARKTPFYEHLLSLLSEIKAGENAKKVEELRAHTKEMEDQIWDVLGKKKSKEKLYMRICNTLFPRGTARREWLKGLLYGKLKVHGGPSECSKEYLVQMNWTGEGKRSDGSLEISPEAMIYGPYIKLPLGKHHLVILIDFPKGGTLEGNIIAESGKVHILSKKLRCGRNDLYFELDRPRENIEFTVKNTTDGKVVLSGLQFF